MGLRKYKYYLKKPKSQIAKEILFWLLVAGGFTLAATSKYFWFSLWKKILFSKFKKYSKKRVSDTFYKLRKKGFIEIKRKNHQLHIALTEEGKKIAGWLQIDDLKIKKPKKWDNK